jgi:CRISPR-associated endonuclease/helicase Cas3
LNETPRLDLPENVTAMNNEAINDALQTEFLTVFENSQKDPFALSMMVKMAYSCLVDADRLDAYLHEKREKYRHPEKNWDTMLNNLSNYLSGFQEDSDIATFRQSISESCAKAGARNLGIYKLEVPTGGGKTLSSLRFALEHAKKHNLDRIIYVIPYLSIVSQTANEIRSALKIAENDTKTVLEHHSGFLPDLKEYYKLQTDRWNGQIILTTQVQFLESIFSAKGSDLRKLHNMARSVLIFDEVQSLPLKCIYLFNSTLHFLNRVCQSTILLCTATQPLIDTVEINLEFSENPSLAKAGILPERTRIVNALEPGGYSYPELKNFVLKKHQNSTLVIVNTKAAAKELYIELKNEGVNVLHLSTNMCSAHREKVIEELRSNLPKKENGKYTKGKPVICISTQLIEAGVNISTECVIRSLAGWDSILQAAGRCNRHGEFDEIKDVYVVNIRGEKLDKLPDIKNGAEVTWRLFEEGRTSINEYYNDYFHARIQRQKMDYPIKDSVHSVYGLLSNNKHGCLALTRRIDKQNTSQPSLRQAIRSASEAFYVIDRGRTEVVVPYGEAMKLLEIYLASDDIEKKRSLLKRLEKYSVSLYKYQMDALTKKGGVSSHGYGNISVLTEGFYDENRGVDLEGQHKFLNY